MEGGLRITGLDVAHDGAQGLHRVLHAFSLELAPREIGCLLGASGCGKTTLLRAIAGFERVRAGTIQLGGLLLSSPTEQVPPERRRVGMMFQEYALFPHLDVRANVAFGLRRLARDAQRTRCDEMLEAVGLGDMAHRYPHELSGGQQQRVALARALAPAPALLLLDEPFSNLDAATRERLVPQVRAILHAAGQAALMVTHHEAEARAIADRVGEIRDGRLARWEAA